MLYVTSVQQVPDDLQGRSEDLIQTMQVVVEPNTRRNKLGVKGIHIQRNPYSEMFPESYPGMHACYAKSGNLEAKPFWDTMAMH